MAAQRRRESGRKPALPPTPEGPGSASMLDVRPQRGRMKETSWSTWSIIVTEEKGRLFSIGSAHPLPDLMLHSLSNDSQTHAPRLDLPSEPRPDIQQPSYTTWTALLNSD